MKKVILSVKILLIGALLMPLNQGCTNLDEQIFSELTAANFPTTEEEFISSLGAAYTSLYFLQNHNSIFSLQEVASDEMLIPQRGGDWFDGGQWHRVHRHTPQANEESINNGWTALYGGVNDCNRVIELFETLVAEGSVEEAEAQAFISEIRALRALYYFWLLDAYGNVPLVTSFSGAENNPANVSRAEVYAFVETELTEALPNLSTAKDGSTYARMNSDAANALLAKLYLNAEVYTGTPQWQKCIDACDAIINSGNYSLEDDYFTNFNAENSGSQENIFVIPYDEAQAQGFNLGQMTLHYQSQQTYNLQEQPWNGYCSLQEFYNSYDDTDKRKGEFGNSAVRGNFVAGPQYAADGTTPLIDAGVEGWIQDPNTGDWSPDPSATVQDPDGPELVFTPEINELEPNCLRQAGVRVGKYEYENGATSNLSNDFPIFRYADILLTKAEAEHRNGNSAAALPLVNMIRMRAGVAEFGALTEDDLLAERGREMFWEGWRRQDLIRFGKFGDTWFAKPASDATKQLFPIPENQINANPNLTQNPGY